MATGGRIAEYVRRVRGEAGAHPAGALPADAALRPPPSPLPTPPPPKKLYRASEVAQHLGLTRQTLHNYATIGLITEEARTPGGQRLFDESVFARLVAIERLKPAHRLHEIRGLLDPGAPPGDSKDGNPDA